MKGRNGIIVGLAILIISCFSPSSYAALSITGIYQGENIKLSNPVCEDGFGMSITKIVVNGKIVPLKFDGAVTEIDFSRIGITVGTTVNIAIDYQNNRCPVIYNSNVLSNALILFDGKEMIGKSDSSFQAYLLDNVKWSQTTTDSEIKKHD